MVEIVRGKPLPPRRGGDNILAVFRAMNPGDSFRVPPDWKLNTVRQYAYKMFSDRQYAVRREAGAYWVYRIDGTSDARIDGTSDAEPKKGDWPTDEDLV